MLSRVRFTLVNTARPWGRRWACARFYASRDAARDKDRRVPRARQPLISLSRNAREKSTAAHRVRRNDRKSRRWSGGRGVKNVEATGRVGRQAKEEQRGRERERERERERTGGTVGIQTVPPLGSSKRWALGAGGGRFDEEREGEGSTPGKHSERDARGWRRGMRRKAVRERDGLAIVGTRATKRALPTRARARLAEACVRMRPYTRPCVSCTRMYGWASERASEKMSVRCVRTYMRACMRACVRACEREWRVDWAALRYVDARQLKSQSFEWNGHYFGPRTFWLHRGVERRGGRQRASQRTRDD